MDAEKMFPSFVVDITKIMELVREKGYSNVLLQVPEGLKPGAVKLASYLEEETESQVFVDGELCYGACDHAGSRAKLLGMDAVIHLGHTDIPSMENEGSVPVHYFPTSMKIDETHLLIGLRAVVDRTGAERIGLSTTVQHLGLLETARDELKKLGKKGIAVMIVDSLYGGSASKTPSENVAREMLRDVMLGVDSRGKAVIVGRKRR